MFSRELLKSIIDYLYMVNSTEPVKEKQSGKREKVSSINQFKTRVGKTVSNRPPLHLHTHLETAHANANIGCWLEVGRKEKERQETKVHYLIHILL